MSKDRFQIGEYYLVRHSNSPVFKAGWYDAKSGQTRRASLGTKDFHEAKVALAEFVTKQAQPKEVKPDEMPLALLLYRYWEGHAKHLVSAQAAKAALGLWTEFWGDKMLGDLTNTAQKDFMSFLKAKGYKNSYVSRTLAVGRAAIGYAWKNNEINSVRFIIDEPDRSDEKEAYLLNISEMKRLLLNAQSRPHLFTYCMIALNTLARPSAVLELTPEQVDLQNARINMNPKGRRQTKKRRPIVPITDTLFSFVSDRNVSTFVRWNDVPIKSIKKNFCGKRKGGGASKRDYTL